MITLSSHAHQLEPRVIEPHPDVCRVLAVARFYQIKHEVDGTETHYWQLTKPLGRYEAGAVITLRKLHEILFG
jgi:hypothetical protein